VRSLRRWLIVAGVWAVAASAIAIIALLSANDNAPKQGPSIVTSSQLSGVQGDLDKRIDALEKQVKALPSSDDVSKLEGRLKTVESKADGASDDLKAVRSDVSDLKKRVDDLEQQQQENSANGGAGTNTTTTP
jgi:polyhydroxyalkanoate synthesis regulator phasin